MEDGQEPLWRLVTKVNEELGAWASVLLGRLLGALVPPSRGLARSRFPERKLIGGGIRQEASQLRTDRIRMVVG